MKLRAGYASNVGLVRRTNEDSYLLRRGLYAVCDGMGGARAGEIASEMACRGLLEADTSVADGQSLAELVRRINRQIAERSQDEVSLQGMGTTLTAALAGQDKLLLVHVGDSRAYLWHEGELTQLTNDHSWVAEMVRRGELTAEEAAVHPHRSVITKALGTERELEPDLLEARVEPGDRLLLCSDGLTGMVPDSDIKETLGWQGMAQEAADLLVAAALAGGGEDNVTVIVVDVLSDDEPADAQTSATQPAVVGEEDADESEGPEPEDGVILGPVDRATVGKTSMAGVAALRGVGAAARGKLSGRLGSRSSRPADAAEAGQGEEGVPAAAAAPTGGGQADTEPRVESEPQPQASPQPQPQALPQPEPQASPRRRRRRWLIVTAIVVIIVVIAIAGFAIFNSAVYYVGTYEGYVALYNGLPGSFLGIDLSSVVEQGTVVYDSLPPYVQERIDTHELTSKAEGQRYLRSLSAVQ